MDSTSKSSHKKNQILKTTYPSNPCVAPPLSTVQESIIESVEQRFKIERGWNKVKRKWISLIEYLECELEASRLLVEKQKNELDTERKCSKELKDAMEMAIEGHARILEQYADLEEKHINLLTSQMRIKDGILDVKKAAAKAGVKTGELLVPLKEAVVTAEYLRFLFLSEASAAIPIFIELVDKVREMLLEVVELLVVVVEEIVDGNETAVHRNDTGVGSGENVVEMDDPNVTMEEYIWLEEEKPIGVVRCITGRLLHTVRSGMIQTFTISNLLKKNSQL
nr:kinesin-like protein KIN-12B [Tanacetum cinerariifolium]